jgi:hypothetical protein
MRKTRTRLIFFTVTVIGQLSIPQIGSESERTKRALIPELATLRPAAFGIRTADSDVNVF